MSWFKGLKIYFFMADTCMKVVNFKAVSMDHQFGRSI